MDDEMTTMMAVVKCAMRIVGWSDKGNTVDAENTRHVSNELST